VTQTQKVDAAARDVLERARAMMFEFSGAERRVAETVLRDPESVLAMGAARLAFVSASSVGTVVRFCHSLGTGGFQDFKIQLATALGASAPSSRIIALPKPKDAAADVLRRTLTSLSRAVDALDSSVVERAGSVLGTADRIHIFGSGPSLLIPASLGAWLSRAGFHCSYPADFDTQAAISARLTERDVCVAVSHSGTTDLTLRAARLAADAGAAVVGLTSFSGSPLAELADVALVAGAPADPYRTADMASRTVHLAVVQAMIAGLVDHPGVKPDDGPTQWFAQTPEHGASA